MKTNDYKNIIKAIEKCEWYARGDSNEAREVKALLDLTLNRVVDLRNEHLPWESVFIANMIKDIQREDGHHRFFLTTEHKKTVTIYLEAPNLPRDLIWNPIPENGNVLSKMLENDIGTFWSGHYLPRYIKSEDRETKVIKFDFSITSSLKSLARESTRSELKRVMDIILFNFN